MKVKKGYLFNDVEWINFILWANSKQIREVYYEINDKEYEDKGTFCRDGYHEDLNLVTDIFHTEVKHNARKNTTRVHKTRK